MVQKSLTLLRAESSCESSRQLSERSTKCDLSRSPWRDRSRRVLPYLSRSACTGSSVAVAAGPPLPPLFLAFSRLFDCDLLTHSRPPKISAQGFARSWD